MDVVASTDASEAMRGDVTGKRGINTSESCRHERHEQRKMNQPGPDHNMKRRKDQQTLRMRDSGCQFVSIRTQFIAVLRSTTGFEDHHRVRGTSVVLPGHSFGIEGSPGSGFGSRSLGFRD